MLFPIGTKEIYAADATGQIKARLKPRVAAHDIKRGKARKISDNFIQYKAQWQHKKPISLRDDEIILVNTVSNYTKKPGWLKASDEVVRDIFLHNERVTRLAMPGLESIPLGCKNAIDDIMLIYEITPVVPLVR